MFIRPHEPYTFSPLHGFRVPGFTFWQRGGFQVGFRVSGFGISVGYKLGFGFRKVRVTSCVVSGRPTIRDVPSFDLSPTSAK